MIYKSLISPFEVMVQLDSKEYYRIFEYTFKPSWPVYFKEEFEMYTPILPTEITKWSKE